MPDTTRGLRDLFIEKHRNSPFDTRYTIRPWTTLIGGTLFIIAVVALIAGWLCGLGVIAVAESFIRAGAVFWAPAAVVIIGITVFTSSRKKAVRATRTAPAIFVARAISMVLTILVALAGLGNLVFIHNYMSYKLYTDDVKTVEKTTSFAERAPWTVAENYASRDQGDIIGDREGVRYVPAARDAEAVDGEGTSRYTTLLTSSPRLKPGDSWA